MLSDCLIILCLNALTLQRLMLSDCLIILCLNALTLIRTLFYLYVSEKFNDFS